MDYSILDFLTLIGAVGMFLYGMKLMSEGLQKVAGDRLRNILAIMTNNRFLGTLTGIFVTALVQSSSATTVMVVSFVNAGLLTLSQSMAVIMGANVGTTVTAWIIAFFGFKVNMSLFVLPMIGVALPFFLSDKSKQKSWGEFLLGFAFLFLGLEYLKNSVPDLKANPEIFAVLTEYTQMGYLSILIFMAIGGILTMVVQASSATLAIALIMSSKGWISFDIAAAMILGGNIGTCITPIIASISGNVSAKRAAMGHFLFNFLGTVWTMILYYPFIRFIVWLSTNYGPGSPEALMNFVDTTDPALINKLNDGTLDLSDPANAGLRKSFEQMQFNVSFALSLFHTVFNIINLMVMIWFTNGYVYLVTKLIKSKSHEEEEFQLRYISSGVIDSGEMSLIQVKNETQVFSERTRKMFTMTEGLLNEKENSESFNKVYARIEKYEKVSDRMELEIANYLNHISSANISTGGEHKIQAMFKVVDEIESIGDSCYHLARTMTRKSEMCANFTPEIQANINKMFKLTGEALDHMNYVIRKNDMPESDLNKAYNKEDEINNFRNQLRNQNIDDINKDSYGYLSGIFYMDIVSECEKIGDYVINVLEALKEKRH
ncbi:MAG: Na/Pi cotransporter family protein [Bacteroidales bacterium]